LKNNTHATLGKIVEKRFLGLLVDNTVACYAVALATVDVGGTTGGEVIRDDAVNRVARRVYLVAACVLLCTAVGVVENLPRILDVQ